jgi:hypothetical protein
MSARKWATLVVGIVFALSNYAQESAWIRRGRSAFLAYQSSRFDRWHPHWIPLILSGVFMAILIIGFYELLVSGINRLLLGPPKTTLGK